MKITIFSNFDDFVYTNEYASSRVNLLIVCESMTIPFLGFLEAVMRTCSLHRDQLRSMIFSLSIHSIYVLNCYSSFIYHLDFIAIDLHLGVMLVKRARSNHVNCLQKFNASSCLRNGISIQEYCCRKLRPRIALQQRSFLVKGLILWYKYLCKKIKRHSPWLEQAKVLHGSSLQHWYR